MTPLGRPRPHTTPATRHGRRSAHAESRSPRQRPRARRISNGVVASYLHDISARHRRAADKARLRPAGEA